MRGKFISNRSAQYISHFIVIQREIRTDDINGENTSRQSLKLTVTCH